MTTGDRIDRALGAALAEAASAPAPATLGAALRYAVLPGGARVRPKLCLAVAAACGDDRPHLTDAAMAAIELIHSASLVHDDLPCFDDADLRRGKPSTHRAFGEEIAVLVGDSLIVLAFETLGKAAEEEPARGLRLVRALAQATGAPQGICAGQGWESEETIDLVAYHQAKTGSLFRAATQMGALAAGHDPEAWTELGARIGAAFQIADDLRDALLDEDALGKPVGQDEVHQRPNAVASFGVEGAVKELKASLGAAISSIPSCPGEAALCDLVRREAIRLTPPAYAAQGAI